MFRPPRYDFASGLYRFGGGHRVVAQSQTHAGWSEAHKKRTGNNDPYSFTQSGMGGNRQIYSPIYERAEAPTLVEDFLPTDIKTQNKIFRNILQYDTIAGPATEYWCSMAFGKNVILSDIEDKDVMKFYEDATEACGLIPEFPLLLLDYLTIGRFVFFLVPDDKKGYWTEHKVLDPDFVRIMVPPFRSMSPVIDWQPSSEERDWAMSDDPRVKEQQTKVDVAIQKAMLDGSSLPLDPIDTVFLPRQQHMTDRYGTSYLCRMLPLKIYEKASMDASIAGMRRRAGPVRVATCPVDYTGTEISEIIDQLYAAEDDPIGGTVAIREGVALGLLGTKDDVLNIKDDWDFLSTAKMRSLGISETMMCLAGSTYIATQEHGIIRIGDLHTDGIAEKKEFQTTITGRNGLAKTSKWIYRGKSNTLRLTTKKRYVLRCTPEHRVLTLSNAGDLIWKQAQEFDVGDFVCLTPTVCTRSTPLALNLPDVPRHPNSHNTKTPIKPEFMTPDLAFLLGMLVSEGCHDHYRARIANSDMALITRCTACLEKLFGLTAYISTRDAIGEVCTIAGKQTKATKLCYNIEVNSSTLSSWLTYLGLLPGGYKKGTLSRSLSWEKVVPWSILQADADSQIAYLAAYIEGDGSVYNEKGGVNFYSQSVKNLHQLQILLSAHGISSTRATRACLYVNQTNARKLHVLVQPYMISKHFGAAGLHKDYRTGSGLRTGVPASFVTTVLRDRFIRWEFPGAWYFNDLHEEVFIHRAGQLFGPSLSRVGFTYQSYKKGMFNKFLTNLRAVSPSTTDKLLSLLSTEYYFDPVISIKKCKPTHVYDLSMAEGEEPAFVANGIVVHNSGETNFNTMEKVMSAFLEKLRGVRELFTRRILSEKIYKTLAKKHRFVKQKQAELDHHYRIARSKEEDESNLMLPTVEWDQPLEPTADRDYWDMLVQLKELGFPVQLRKWAQAAGYDFKKMLQNQQSELDDRAKMYALRKALKEQAEKFGFEEDGTPSGGLGGAGGEAGGLDLGGGPEVGGGPELGGGGPPLGGGGGGGPELGGGPPEAGGAPEAAPPPAAPAPAAGPGGAAADLQAARFNLVQPPQTYRRATVYSAKPYDLETELSKLPLWEKDTTALGLPRRRVAQLVEDVTHLEPHQRNRDEFYQRMRRQHGCTSVQADLVQYCAARVGLVESPRLTRDGVSLLQTILVAQAKKGLTAVVDRELDCLARIAQREPDDLGTGNVRSRDVLSLGNNQILTGLTK